MTARLAQRHIYATQVFKTTRMEVALSFGRSCTLFLEEMTDGLEEEILIDVNYNSGLKTLG